MTEHADTSFWFADIDEERAPSAEWAWRPFLQLPGGGGVAPVDQWFASKDDCDEFIRARLVGAGHRP